VFLFIVSSVLPHLIYVIINIERVIKMEEWRAVKGFEGWYEISDMGRIRSLDRVIHHIEDKVYNKSKIQINEGKILTPQANNRGYYYIMLYRNSKHYKRYIHRLVAEAFLPAPPKSYRVVNHISGNHQDNRKENLEWCTQKQNINHAFDNGLVKTRKRVRSINIETNEVKEYDGICIAGRQLGISHTGIVQCLKGRAKLCNGCKWEYI
jgi:hypothetical protein